ncbi:hypothetical protein LTR62_000885 [Meristemomyces frigidus]|uniref:S-adenosyl-L-methionine-dependent methyltransferase n=1 Tax=Meristemomyces frigidus TaxID=1508187 RepID=A0AAN7YBY1_9PEZI|nr:hypothetical protein LTR62_000885 [Meristemomyces frigidus]
MTGFVSSLAEVADYLAGYRRPTSGNQHWAEWHKVNTSLSMDRAMDVGGTGSVGLWPRLARTERLPAESQVLDNNAGREPRSNASGCGTGYDPVMLAQHGFEAWGLELSAKAVRIAEEYARSARRTAKGGSRGESIGPRTINFLQGDFFAHEWQASLPFEATKFDLVYDYTFLCALLPESRKDWATRMAELVKPGGYLICLEFPLWKDNRSPGPPWGMTGVIWDLLANGGDGVLMSNGEGEVEGGEGKFERIQYLKPAESFKQGRGRDMLSVWRRKRSD